MASAESLGCLGRVVTPDGTAVGTCFQVSPGVLVTAWHVLHSLGVAAVGAEVLVDPLAGGPAVPARVHAVDEPHDLAVLLRAEPLKASVAGLLTSDGIGRRTEVVITGTADFEDRQAHRWLEATGLWQGLAQGADEVTVGRVESSAVVPGMSGAPVRRIIGDQVVGIVSARYNSADGWMRDTVWVARTEQLVPLLAGVSPVRPAPPADPEEPQVTPTLVRVRDAQPGWLRIHAAAPRAAATGGPPPDMPRYVARDHDVKLRRRLDAAARSGGGLVLVKGRSATGKSRSLFETIRALLGDWWLFVPDGPGDVRSALDALPPRTLVWLDDTPMERFITASGQGGLTMGELRRLLTGPGPVIVVDSMWPVRYQELVRRPDTPQETDANRDARDILNLDPDPIQVPDQLSGAERQRAQAAAVTDPRLWQALGDGRFGVTQHLAGAPHLIARWADAHDAEPHAEALVTAAVDARRIGVHTPLTLGFLRAAAGEDERFDDALAYALDDRRPGGMSLLVEQVDDATGAPGYSVNDYLLQHCLRRRWHAALPRRMWDALAEHVGNAADLNRVGYSAETRLLYGYARTFYRRAALAGDVSARDRLLALLTEHGWPDEFIETLELLVASDGDYSLRKDLARLLAESGRIDALRLRAADDDQAALRLADWLAEHERVEEAVETLGLLCERDVSGARWRRATLLAQCDDLDTLRQLALAGDRDAAWSAVTWLLEHDELDHAAEFARELGGSAPLVHDIADHLVERGRVDDAIELLSHDDGGGGHRLAYLLAEHGRIDRLRSLADAGDRNARDRLAGWLIEHDGLDELRDRATHGDEEALRELVDLLAERGSVDEAVALLRRLNQQGKFAHWLVDHDRLDEVRALAEAGNADARTTLVYCYIDARRLDDAISVLRPVDAVDTRTVAWPPLPDYLMERQDVRAYRRRYDSGDIRAGMEIVTWLGVRQFVDEARYLMLALDSAHGLFEREALGQALRDRGRVAEAIEVVLPVAEVGFTRVTRWLVLLLADQGRIDEALALLRPLTEVNYTDPEWQFAHLQAEQGNPWSATVYNQAREQLDEYRSLLLGLALRHDHIDEVRRLAALGDKQAQHELARWLLKHRRADELRERADADSISAGTWREPLARWLAKHKKLDELRQRAAAGDPWAQNALARWLTKKGCADELRQRAEAGEVPAVCAYAEWLASRRRLDDAVSVLHDLAVAGDHWAGQMVAQWCAEQGRMDELRTLADAGVGSAGRRLSEWLAGSGRIDELKLRTLAGDYSARVALVQMAEEGRVPGGQELLFGGLEPDGSLATGPAR
ncbi:trypsin-like peptidase domain-containing protein [Nonomuraea rubra]